MEWATANSNEPELLAALQYKKLMDVTAAEMKGKEAQFLTIRYEDFVANPSATINNILSFAGLESSPMIDEYMAGIKIYNQNKQGADNSGVNTSTALTDILNGEFAF
jgi:hypothetical protein